MDLDAFFGGGGAAAEAPPAYTPPASSDDPFGTVPSTSAPSATSGGDFFDMLGVSSSSSSTADSSSGQKSGFIRGASKYQEPPKKELNLDAFSQLAIASAQKAPVAQAQKQVPARKVSVSESESESESGSSSSSSEDEKPAAKPSTNSKATAATVMQAQAKPAAEAPAVVGERKMRGEWSVDKKTVPTKLGFVKNITTWKFFFKGEQHKVELRHSTFSGKRVILVDSRTLVDEKKMIGGDCAHKLFAGSEFETRCDITVVIKSVNDRFTYGIFIEGLPIRDARAKFAEYI